ncbi:MAG: hypothetical protein Q4E75_06635 [bacterium]|nr:hypothetical protein [bacterium]
MLIINIFVLLLILIIIGVGLYRKNRGFITIGICLALLLLIALSIYFIYKEETKNIVIPNLSSEEMEEILPIPNRIIYKNDNNEYLILDQYSGNVFSYIYSEMYNRVTNKIEGKVYSEDEIAKMQENGSFIEFDYNTKSKNYVFFLDENEVGAIKRFTDSGQVISTHFDNKEKIVKKLKFYERRFEKYDFYSKSYISSEKLEDFSSNYGITLKRDGVFQTVIEYAEEDNMDFLNMLDSLKFKIDEEIPNIDFDKQNVIITISRYDYENIKVNIGNVKYEFGNKNDFYTVNLLVVSKVTNTKCIYYNIVDTFEKNNTNEISNITNVTTSNMVQKITDSTIEIGFEGNNVEYSIKVKISIKDINIGDIIYVEGEKGLEKNGVLQINANSIEVCDRKKAKDEISLWLLNTYRVDGPGIEYYLVDNNGKGYIIVACYYDKFKYPIKMNVNNETETYLGMGRHLQSNYGYVLHEMCDITLDTKITDIDNIKGYVKIIEYIAD